MKLHNLAPKKELNLGTGRKQDSIGCYKEHSRKVAWICNDKQEFTTNMDLAIGMLGVMAIVAPPLGVIAAVGGALKKAFDQSDCQKRINDMTDMMEGIAQDVVSRSKIKDAKTDLEKV